MIKTLSIKNKILGGECAVCASLVGRNETELNEELELAEAALPDFLEWRADFFESVEENGSYVRILKKIEQHLPETPLIFTLRSETENGGVNTYSAKKIGQDERLAIIDYVIKSGAADIVDIELSNGQAFIGAVISAAKRGGVYTILSHHDFNSTPPAEQIKALLIKLQNTNADIIKLAVMPNSEPDVQMFMNAVKTFTDFYANVPVIAMSMSQFGVVTRIDGRSFGSCLSFGSLKTASAPGQIPVGQLRKAMKIQ